MSDALVDVVERLLEYSGSHVLLFLVLIQDFQQHLVHKREERETNLFGVHIPLPLHPLKSSPAVQPLRIP